MHYSDQKVTANTFIVFQKISCKSSNVLIGSCLSSKHACTVRAFTTTDDLMNVDMRIKAEIKSVHYIKRSCPNIKIGLNLFFTS